jgi:two-component sensor histidine kinase
MRHRINNLFAITNALVTLSARMSKTPLEMEAAIKERLAALSRAQQLTRRGLIQAESEFSGQPTLKGLIHAIFAPYVTAGSNSPERIVVTGCDQEINDSAVTSIALLLTSLPPMQLSMELYRRQPVLFTSTVPLKRTGLS